MTDSQPSDVKLSIDDQNQLVPDEPTDTENSSADEADVNHNTKDESCPDKDGDTKDEGCPDKDGDVHVVCPECQCKKRRKTGGFPFGRKPTDPDAPKKVKEDPKTQWGKFQRQYCQKYSGLPSAMACALARIYYVPVHADGTKSPKSLERLLRETHAFLVPLVKSMDDESRAAALRSWVEDLMRNAILERRLKLNSLENSNSPSSINNS